jgi:two-component system cell cycle sensor histidine kinase/response regulator CckA
MKDMGLSEVRPAAPLRPPRFPRWLIAVEIVVAIAVVAGGIWVSVDQLRAARRGVEDDLLAVGRLKTQQIVEWRKERLGDAGIIAGSRPFGDLVVRWLDSRQQADAAQIIAWFQTISQYSGYADVRLVDPSGRVLLDSSVDGGPLATGALGGLQVALASRKAILTDLHFGSGGKTVDQDVVAPLFDSATPDGQPLGAVVLSADAGDFLFPLIQTWPMDSVSAETLLVERDGDQVLFLNDLRFRTGAALTLKLPLTQKNLPAVMAVLGREGIVEGADYRGVKVVGAVQSIPGSPWFIIAKIDSSEAFAAARLRTGLAAGMFALFLLGLFGGTELYWQRGLKARYREAHDLELSRRALLARHEHLVQLANDIILVADASRHIVEANERALESYGYSREEFLGLRIEDLVPSSDVPALMARLQRLEHEDSYVAETAHRRKDGSTFPAEASGRSIEIGGEKYVHTIVRDITERKRAEAELALTGFSVNHASDSVFWLDPDGRILFVSDSTCERHGYSRDELLTMTVEDLDPSHSREEWAEHWREVKETGALEIETTHRTKEGTWFPVEIRNNYVTFEGVEYGCVFARDITERKQAEETLRNRDEQLRQSQKMEAVGQLAGGIAHDFNNLMAAVVGYSDLLLAREGAFDLTVREDIEEIRRAADRASSLTKQILAFSRRQALRPTVASLNSVLKGMGPLLRHTLGENIDLVTIERDDLGLVEVDVHQFEQVLLNLAVNARDAMSSGGRLTLETANAELDQDYCLTHSEAIPGRYVMLAVSDTGIGMDEATLGHIFEPFFTTKARDKGTGLGLSMVYGTVKQSNGSISVYSEPGKGTSFKIYLPRVTAAEEEVGSAAANGRSNLGSGTILVVEDEISLQRLVVRVLEALGYRVIAASSGAEALHLAKQQERPPDLLLTDVVLPGEMQGNDLARELVAATPGLAVLYMSGYTRNAIVHAGRLDAGVNFLEKPFTPQALGAAVQDVLAGRPPSPAR